MAEFAAAFGPRRATVCKPMGTRNPHGGTLERHCTSPHPGRKVSQPGPAVKPSPRAGRATFLHIFMYPALL
jgi:hypothetical protein